MKLFICEMCGGTFECDGTSEEEKVAEMKQFFGDLRPEERASVCDDCFQKIHPDKFPWVVEGAMAQTIRARENGSPNH